MIRFLNAYFPTRAVVLLVCEVVLVWLCFLAAALYRLGPDASLVLVYEDGYIKLGVVTLLVVGLSYYFDLYEPQIVNVEFEIYFRILLVLGFGCMLVGVTMFFWPRAWIADNTYTTGFALLTPMLIFWRKCYEWIVNLPYFRDRVFVLGSGERATRLVETVRKRRDVGMEIVNWDPSVQDLPVAERRELWATRLRELRTIQPPVGLVIVALDEHRNELPAEQLLHTRMQGISVELVGTLRERLDGKIEIRGLRSSDLIYSQGFSASRSQQFMQLALSTLVSGFALALFLPFFPIVALLVKLSSPGPIFFRQTRVGLGGKNFTVYKFRSMGTDAEKHGAKWAVKNDPRVTRWGMIMRKTRIDEIPQLWNVLRGDMALVGPRPERPEFVPLLVEQLPFYELRHLIRPGLTGWAQVRYGYGATIEETREKLEYDLYYVKHMSLGLDLLIMFETIKIIIRRRGAQ